MRKKRKLFAGFTFVEVLFAALIGAFIVGSLFYVLSAGSRINQVSSSKILLQSQARRITDWIARDLREAVVWDVANNSPTSAHIKFKPVTGWDTATNTYLLDTNFVDYTYNSGLKTLTRSILTDAGTLAGVSPNSWVFNNVAALPFSTQDDAGNVLDMSNVGTTKRVVILITTRNQAGEELSLISEVKIRNE